MATVLVIRLSAIGDVAMSVPAVASLAAQYPQHRIVVVSKKNFAPLFQTLPGNVEFAGYDKQIYKGFSGLNRFYREVKKKGITHVADLNGVLVSLYLSFRFRASGKKVAVIRKQKRAQRLLTRKHHKVMKPLTSTFERYRQVFVRLGFPFQWSFRSVFEEIGPDHPVMERVQEKKADEKWIGIAPFAAQKGKIYPIELQEKVIEHFARKNNVRLFLFGGGKKEAAVFNRWVSEYPSVCSMAGRFDMYGELQLMRQLDVMVSMDSGNMHLASLAGVSVVSVWGATHPYCGFMGWGQKEENAVQLPLECRPCSAHGTKPCYKNTWECLYKISPSRIIEKVETVLSQEAR